MFLRRLVKWLVAACIAVVLALQEAGAALHLVKYEWQHALAGVSLPVLSTWGFVLLILFVVVAACSVCFVIGALNWSRVADSLERLGGRIRSSGLPPPRKTPEGLNKVKL
jgi:hypothetical protein